MEKMENKEKEFFKKITVINIVLSILIVILHANCSKYVSMIESEQIANCLKMMFNTIRVFTDSAVPMFFAISAYLFFRNFEISKYPEKLKKRFFSIVIPYLIFNIGFYIVLLILTNMSNIEGIKPIKFNMNSILKALWCEYNPPLWFLRTLIVYVIASPIFYYIIKKAKKWSLVIPIIMIFCNMLFKFSYSEATSNLFWLPTYFFGAYLAMQKREWIEKKIELAKSYRILIFIVWIIICILLANVSEKSQIYYLYRVISPIFIWFTIDTLIPKLQDKKNISFFIFCTHYPIIRIVKNVLIKVIGGTTAIQILIVYIGAIICTIIIIYLLYRLLDKYVNCVWKLMNGGRS